MLKTCSEALSLMMFLALIFVIAGMLCGAF